MNEFPQFLAGRRLCVFLLVMGLLFSAVTFAQTAQSYRQQAVELSRNKSWDQAIASYRKALDLEPNDPDTHYNLALTLKYKGDAKQAVEEFEATLRLKPKWADAHYGLGATWFDLHDRAAALKELHTAIDLDPANVGAHRLRHIASWRAFICSRTILRPLSASYGGRYNRSPLPICI